MSLENNRHLASVYKFLKMRFLKNNRLMPLAYDFLKNNRHMPLIYEIPQESQWVPFPLSDK